MFIVVDTVKQLRVFGMKIELEPLRTRRTFSSASSPEPFTSAKSEEFAHLIRQLSRRWSFDEICGQFRIYREDSGSIILKLQVFENDLDEIERDLDSSKK
jgi:hypothetical protein